MNQLHLEEIIRPVVESFGCLLWGLSLQSGQTALLRIYIDKEDGVSITDCEKISRHLSALFDVEDPITSNYTLEVSSPGLDRPLFSIEQYQRYIGSTISIALSIAFERRKNYKGVLQRIEDNEVVIHVDNNEYQFPIEGIHKARVVPF